MKEDPQSVVLLASSEEFQGACLATGAQRTVIGKPQAEAYLALIGKDIRPDKAKDPRRSRLGGSDYDTIGAVSIRLPDADDYFLPLIVNVMALNVPFLLGLDTFDLHRIVCEQRHQPLDVRRQGCGRALSAQVWPHLPRLGLKDPLHFSGSAAHPGALQPCQAGAPLRPHAPSQGPPGNA